MPHYPMLIPISSICTASLSQFPSPLPIHFHTHLLTYPN